MFREAQLYSHTVLPKFTDKLLLGKAKQAHIELSHTCINSTILLITTMSMCHVFIPHSPNFSYHIILMYNAHYKRLDTGGYGICLLRVLPLLFSLACDRAIHRVVQFLVLVTHDCIYIYLGDISPRVQVSVELMRIPRQPLQPHRSVSTPLLFHTHLLYTPTTMWSSHFIATHTDC